MRLKYLLSVPGNDHVELYMVVDRGVLHGQLTNQGISFSHVDSGVLHGQLTNQGISFSHVYTQGQFTRMVIDSTNEVGFLYESSGYNFFRYNNMLLF